MHKRRFNDFTLSFAIRPAGPLLIKSGQESGADPTLLDMNFVRTRHAAIGRPTVYLPGSSLKGALRSYAEKIARTLAEGSGRQPPLSCNPLGNGKNPGRDDYACGRYLDNERFTPADKHARACPICRVFGHHFLAAHIRISDAYPLDPGQPENLAILEQTNQTGERDGVAIDRVSGAVAVGPFNLEVVTQGAFFGSLTLHNFQFWQIGLLAVVLRDLGRGHVPIGFGKSRGLGRVAVEYQAAEVGYPGRFGFQESGRDFAAQLYGVDSFMKGDEAAAYGYQQEDSLPLPSGSDGHDDGSFGRVSRRWTGHDPVEGFLRANVPYWAAFVRPWMEEASGG